MFASWKLIAGCVVTAAVLGLGGSFLLHRQYTSSATFVPEQSKTSAIPSGLGALAGQLGVLPDAGNTDSPEFYQRLLTGRAVRTAVLLTPVNGVDLMAYFGGRGRSDSLEHAIKQLEKASTVSIDKSTGTVRVDVEVREPALAEALVARYLSEVDRYNSTIRRTRARKRREFVQSRTDSALVDLQQAEGALLNFLTENRVAASPTLQFERARLERRVNTAQEVYLDLERQLQTARIDEVNDTPVISVIDPPYLPERASAPHRAMITLMAMFCAGVLSIVYVLFAPRGLPPHRGN